MSRTVLVTRAAEQAEGTAARLRERGHVPVVAPLVRIEQLPAAVPEAQAILVTSRNGAAALAGATDARAVPVLAVGEATAATLRAEGFGDVRSADGDAAALAALAAASLDPAGGPVLHARGATVRHSPLPALQAAGFATGEAVLYRTVALDALPDVSACDTALVHSPASAERLVRALQDRDTALDVVAMSDAALVPLRGTAFARSLHAATHPSESAMLDLLDALPKKPVAAARFRR